MDKIESHGLFLPPAVFTPVRNGNKP
jgi:hypothetical protein